MQPSTNSVAYRCYVGANGYRLTTLLNCVPTDLQRILADQMPIETQQIMAEINLNIPVDVNPLNAVPDNDQLARYAIEHDYINIIRWQMKTRRCTVDKVNLYQLIKRNAINTFKFFFEFRRYSDVGKELWPVEGMLIHAVLCTRMEIVEYIHDRYKEMLSVSTIPNDIFMYLHDDSRVVVTWLWNRGYRPTDANFRTHLRANFVTNIKCMIDFGYKCQAPTDMISYFIECAVNERTVLELIKYSMTHGKEKLYPSHFNLAMKTRRYYVIKFMMANGYLLQGDELIAVCNTKDKYFIADVIEAGYNLRKLIDIDTFCTPGLIAEIDSLIETYL
jgi:hypothetical protein